MSEEGIELPAEWLEAGWTLESALADDEGNDSEWGASVVLAAADPSEVQGEEGTAIG
jgi:hypothetical protein